MPLNVIYKKYDDVSDELLAQRFKDSGDLDVLGTLYERYLHLIYGVCLKYLQNREEAQDAVTGIFEKLIVELPKQEVKTFKSWLYVLTKNYCLMQIRSQKSTSRKMEAWQMEQEYFVESNEELHPIDEDEASMNKKLIECLQKLKDEQQKCIQLFYFENKSYREISSMTKLKEKKVKSYIQNGKRNLRICIEGNDGKKA